MMRSTNPLIIIVIMGQIQIFMHASGSLFVLTRQMAPGEKSATFESPCCSCCLALMNLVAAVLAHRSSSLPE